jgi:hypothetical protein
MKIFITLFLIAFSGSVHAEVPQEIQGIWTPDIEKTIVLMEKNMDEIDSDYMRKKYLPKLKRTIMRSAIITDAELLISDHESRGKQVFDHQTT